RRQARRLAGSADHQGRAVHQWQHRQGARTRDARRAARTGRRGDRMKRRAFMTLLAGAAAVPILPARAQQPGKLPTIGILGSASAGWSKLVAALLQRLRELGYVENRTIAIEYRWTEGRNDRYGEIAAELVRLKVDVIVALGTPAIVAAKKATSVIPIVVPLASDPG